MNVIPVPQLNIPGSVRSRLSTEVGVTNKLGATSDLHAVELWLNEHSAGTRRDYMRHSARFLAWLHSVQLKLDTCTYDHLSAYFAQLDDPALLREHIERFVPPEGRAAMYKGFALDVATVTPGRAARSRKILVALFRWLQLSGYVSHVAIPRLQPALRADNTTIGTDERVGRVEMQREQLSKRVLSDEQWKHVDAAIDALNWLDPKHARCRAIAVWLRDSGVRREELASARLGSLLRQDIPVKDRKADHSPHFWMWQIRGKGNKVRRVGVSAEMIDAFKRYRLSMGVPFFEDDPFLLPRGVPDAYLFYGHHNDAIGSPTAMSPITVYNDVRMLAAIASLSCTTETDRARVASLSPHWFRHRCAQALTKRMNIVQVAQYLGHSSIETTKTYSLQDEVDLAWAVVKAAPAPNEKKSDNTPKQ